MKHLRKAVCHFGGKYFNCDCFVVVSDKDGRSKRNDEDKRPEAVRGEFYGSQEESVVQDPAEVAIDARSRRESLGPAWRTTPS